MSDSIVVAFMGLIGVLATAFFSYLANKKKSLQLTQMNKEMSLQRSALSLSDFLSKWPEVYADIKEIMNSTNIDRFMICRAWNGELEPKWVTSIFQIRMGDQEPISYVHFEVDEDYAERLRLLKSKYLKFKTEEISDSVVKRIYSAEGIAHSFWAHIEEHSDGNSASHSYCSFSTHNGEIEEFTELKCKILASKLRDIIAI